MFSERCRHKYTEYEVHTMNGNFSRVIIFFTLFETAVHGSKKSLEETISICKITNLLKMWPYMVSLNTNESMPLLL